MSPEKFETLAQRIAFAVKKAGGQTEVSEKTGVSVRSISSYSNEGAEPKFSFVKELAEMSGLSLEWIATGKENKCLELKSVPETKTAQVKYEPIEIEALEKAVELTEKAEKAYGVKLSTQKRARVIALIYEDIYGDENEEIKNVCFDNVIKLVRAAV